MAAITEPITFSAFPRGMRQPGTYPSASAEIPEGVYSIGISDTMTDGDAADPALSFTLWTEVSTDGGTAWTAWGFREEWHGGTFVDKGTGATVPRHFRMAWSNSHLASDALVGMLARAVITQSAAMRVGFNIVAYPAGFHPA